MFRYMLISRINFLKYEIIIYTRDETKRIPFAPFPGLGWQTGWFCDGELKVEHVGWLEHEDYFEVKLKPICLLSAMKALPDEQKQLAKAAEFIGRHMAKLGSSEIAWIADREDNCLSDESMPEFREAVKKAMAEFQHKYPE